MSSGIALNDDALRDYNQLQRPSADSDKLRYIIFRISDDKKQIIVEKKAVPQGSDRSPTEAETQEFLRYLKDSQTCRYAVFDDGVKPILIFWNPDAAKVKDKMIYASSFDAIKKKFTGVGSTFQMDDIGELEQELRKNQAKS